MSAIPETTRKRLVDLDAEIDSLNASAAELRVKIADNDERRSRLAIERIITHLTLKEAGLIEGAASAERKGTVSDG